MGALDGFVLNHANRRAALDGLANTFGQIAQDRKAKAEGEALKGNAAQLAQSFGASPEQAAQMVEGASAGGALPQAFQALYQMKLREMAPLTKMEAAALEGQKEDRSYRRERDEVTDTRADRQFEASRSDSARTFANQDRAFEAGRSDEGFNRDIQIATLQDSKEDRRLQRESKAAEKEGKESKANFEMAAKLRDKFHSQGGKAIQNITEGLNGLRASSGEDTAAGDLALLFSYGKVLDPGSVVREGELETLSNLGGIGDRLYRLALKADTGQRLTPDMRAEIMRAAEITAREKVSTFEPVIEQYRTLAEAADIDPGDVIPDYQRFYEDSPSHADEPSVDIDKVNPADIQGMTDEQLKAIIDG